MQLTTRGWAALYAIVVAGFLAAVASYYHPGVGVTAFIELPADGHADWEIAAVRNTPHAHTPTGGYDGQFYAQLAVEPLVRDAAIDHALDRPAYRARRILFSWTAWAAGLGRPAWILQVYALQNVVAWLLLAWILIRWFPIGSARNFVLWTGCLLSVGLLESVRLAVIDGPSLLLITTAVVTAEKKSLWLTAVVLGIAGLARETNLLAAIVLLPWLTRSPRSWVMVAAALLLSLIPLLLWIDYLRSVYLQDVFDGGGHITTPLIGLWWKTQMTMGQVVHGWNMSVMTNVIAIVAFVVQGGFVAWRAVTMRGARPAWLLVSVLFLGLMLCTDRTVWEGSPGAIARVTLPLAIGFNVMARSASWPIIVLGNLTVIAGVLSFAFSIR